MQQELFRNSLPEKSQILNKDPVIPDVKTIGQ